MKLGTNFGVIYFLIFGLFFRPCIPVNSHDISYWRKFNTSKCCPSNLKLYLYNIDLRNRSSIISNSTNIPYWGLGYHCYFPRYGALNMMNHEIIDWFKFYGHKAIITTNPEDACLFILPAIPNGCFAPPHLKKSLNKQYKFSDADIQRKLVAKWLRRLPYWNLHGYDGSNHVLLDFYDMNDEGPWINAGRVWSSETKSIIWDRIFPFASLDTGNSIIIGSSLDRRSFRRGFDISTFLLHTYPRINMKKNKKKYINQFTIDIELGVNTDTIAREQWKNRSALVCFFGKVYTNCCNIRQEIQKLAIKIHNSSILLTDDIGAIAGSSYASKLTHCKFGLVPRGKGYHSFRLLEVMAAGAIPVIFNDFGVLPFEDIWDWTNLGLVYTEQDVTRAITEIETMNHKNLNFIEEIHKNGVEIYNTFLESRLELWDLIVKTLINNVKNQRLNKSVCK
eukprot:gene2456-4769_t